MRGADALDAAAELRNPRKHAVIGKEQVTAFGVTARGEGPDDLIDFPASTSSSARMSFGISPGNDTSSRLALRRVSRRLPSACIRHLDDLLRDAAAGRSSCRQERDSDATCAFLRRSSTTAVGVRHVHVQQA